MIKNYVLDTNVFLLDPQCINKFEDNNIVIPIGVIEELDTFKKDQSELGRNARETSRILDTLRTEGDLRTGVKIGSGKLSVRYNGNLNSYYKEKRVDLHILHIAKKVSEEDPSTPCIIISRDINVRIRANALGIDAQNYEGDKIHHNDMETGFDDVAVASEIFEKLATEEEIEADAVLSDIELYPNLYLIVHDVSREKSSLLAKVGHSGKTVNRIENPPKDVGIFARNKEQLFAMNALLDPGIKLVTINGKAGSGKTILSVAIGYYMAVKRSQYKRLLVSRPVFPMGKDIGFLPGDINEKLDPWMNPIYDAFDVLMGDSKGGGKQLVDGNKVMVEPLMYIRGRSIRDQFLIVDEAQNLSRHEIKTIITRAGENTKVVLTGDIYQIDNPYLDSLSNGLSVVSTAMKGSYLSAHLSLEKCERSELAEEAADKL